VGHAAFIGALAVVCAAALPIAGANAQTAQSSPKAPLTLAEHGYFFVGGQYVESGGKKLMAGQMYVEYLTPQHVTHPYPILMIHGTAQTGTNFLGTPDGRPGWAHNFLARGYRVFVVDQVGRGRSGADPQIYGPYMRFAAEQEESLFTAPEKYKLWPQAGLHTQWPGGLGIAGDPAFDQFYASQDRIKRWGGTSLCASAILDSKPQEGGSMPLSFRTREASSLWRTFRRECAASGFCAIAPTPAAYTV
jgi:hypothetical protein